MGLEALKEEITKALSTTVVEPVWAEAAGDLALHVLPGSLKAVAAALKGVGFRLLLAVAVVDEGETFRVVYPLCSLERRVRLILMTSVPRQAPDIDSLAEVWPAANWHEREQAELFGVTFVGHPDPRHLLLPDDWEGYPLRKDYKEPEVYRGISTGRPYWEDEGCSRSN